ncbi:MAG: hypothetical protein JNK46_09505, partial [Methylobacteriaceae bacterium]|nr:hypothetical protein [Methylobacteriaceae bacterium]
MTPRSLIRRTASTLNSRPNLRLPIGHLRLHETPILGVHETGSRPDRLRLRGYEVDYQVGVSGFRIDLGIRHPDHRERYLAGVECDGARYHSSKSARDRDRLREEVLRGLGWDLVRVWSTDWFDNPDLQTERLVMQLEELRARPAPVDMDYQFAGASLHTDPNLRLEVSPSTVAVDDNAAPNGDRNISPESDREGLDGTERSPSDSPKPAQAREAASLLDGAGALGETDLGRALREFRDTIIAVEMPNWEPHRSILREAMIETFIAQRINDPDQWFSKVPQFQRQGTAPAEKARYIERICDLVARLEAKGPPTPRPPA